MTYVQDLLEGMHINQVFLVKQKQSAVSKTGKNYYSLKLRDKTGEVDAKIWSLNNAIEHFEVNDFVMAEGEVRSFNNALQISINRIRRAKEGEYDEAEYMPASAIPVDKMYAELMDLRSKVENPHLKRLLEAFFVEDQDFIRTFKAHSAAKSVHHNFLGGLLQHTLRVTQLCYFFCKQYPMLNKDLLLTAAMFHDIGKTRELSEFPDNDYTDEGQLLGHIVIGYEMVKKKIDEIGGFPKKLETELLHCILAHQGQLEYGSPKKPSIMEALALYYADDTDAKLEIMIEEFQNSNSTGFLGLNRFLGTNIRKTSQEE
ncbi:MAG: HD domain-containing protein [Lachnospiraceae bacterium]|nr:HD domain-containing protein [Lachnospiraceae bacterium]MBQ7602192.1 HD domain-containing protein [Lachnospiraceae bacterium]